MISKEILANVRRIEIRTRRIVNEMTAGAYHSVFKGRGVEFAEVREYLPGDDIRAIDWRVTARSGEPHTKLFHEDHEQPITVAVDLRQSMYFGSRFAFKSVLAAHAASL